MALTNGPAANTPAAAAAWCGNKSGDTINDEASRQHLPVSSAQPSGEAVKRIVGRRKRADLPMQHHQTQEKFTGVLFPWRSE